MSETPWADSPIHKMIRDAGVDDGSSLAASHCSADKLPKEQDEMARDIACFLWEHSAIRHGMFTPPEFIPMASSIIREYFKQQNTEAQQRDSD